VRVAVVVVPVTIGVPAVLIFIPPAMIRTPAILASIAQLVPRMFRLFAVPAVMLDSIVKMVIGLRNTVLAFGFVGPYARRCGKNQECGQRSASQNQFP